MSPKSERGSQPNRGAERPTELRKFLAPEFVFGAGARRLVEQYAGNLGVTRILLVSDPGVAAAGWMDEVRQRLQAAEFTVVDFKQVTPNPRAEEVMVGAERYLREGCNGIVVVGGGSPLDCAKGIGIVAAHDRHILEFEGIDRVVTPIPPLIAIPTTAGSAADVSQFTMITDSRRRVKVSIVSKAIVPDVALIDPETALTMPRDVAVYSGVDALTHAIEAYVSNASSAITDLFALEALRLAVQNLPASIEQPRDLVLRGRVMTAALDAGLAFSNASLGAVHAMAHALGGLLDLPHGLCNGLLLPHVVGFNYEAAPERHGDLARALGLDLAAAPASETRARLVERLSGFLRGMQLSRSLSELGLRREDIPRLAEHAMSDPCLVTNVRWPRQAELEALFGQAF